MPASHRRGASATATGAAALRTARAATAAGSCRTPASLVAVPDAGGPRGAPPGPVSQPGAEDLHAAAVAADADPLRPLAAPVVVRRRARPLDDERHGPAGTDDSGAAAYEGSISITVPHTRQDAAAAPRP